MNRRKFIAYSTITAAIWLTGCTNDKKTTSTASTNSTTHEDPTGYWTCPMHPQVHQHEPGKCPICGMPLVIVDKTKKPAKVESESIEVSDDQLKNAQISKYTVTKEDLEINISASGRIVSSRRVAFQVYESDVASVKGAAIFSGSSSSNPGKTFQGRITRVDNLIDPSSRTVRVDGTLDHPLPNAISESSFHGEITSTIKDQVVVPVDSVLHAGTRELVYVFSTNNKLEPREVQLGQKGKRYYQILGGLEVGEVISSGPNFLIDSEAKLRGQQ